MLEDNEPKDTWGNRYQQHTDGSRSNERTDVWGNKYWEHPDGSWSQERTDAFGNKYEQHQDGRWSTKHTDSWGNTYKEHSDGTRSYQRTDFWGNTYWEHTDKNPYNTSKKSNSVPDVSVGGGVLGGLFVLLFVGWFALFSHKKSVAILIPLMVVITYGLPYHLPMARLFCVITVTALIPFLLLASTVDLNWVGSFALSCTIGVILSISKIWGPLLTTPYIPSLFVAITLSCSFFVLHLLLKHWACGRPNQLTLRIALQFAGAVVLTRFIVDAIIIPYVFLGDTNMFEVGISPLAFLMSYLTSGILALLACFLVWKTSAPSLVQ